LQITVAVVLEFLKPMVILRKNQKDKGKEFKLLQLMGYEENCARCFRQLDREHAHCDIALHSSVSPTDSARVDRKR